MLRLLNKIGLTTWRRRIVALAIFFPVMGIVSVEVTSQSWFCNSCHIMGPYYDSWKHGSHKDVECVKCHISPGVENFLAAKFNGLGQVVDDVLHRTSMKPSASVSELACLRSGCHDLGVITKSQKTSGKFLFRHDKHLGLEYSGIKVACSTCHSHVKGTEHFELNTNVCVTCHLIKSDPTSGASPEGTLAADGSRLGPGIIRLAVREGPAGEVAGEKSSSAPPAEHAGSLPVGTPASSGAAAAPKLAAPGTAAAPAIPAAHPKSPPEGCLACHTPPAGTIERGGLRITHAEYLAYGAKCESCHRGTTAVPVPIESGQCYVCHAFGLERNGSAEEMHRIHNEGPHKIECFSCHGSVHHGPKAQAARLDQFDCRKCHTDQHGVQRRTYLHDTTGSGSKTEPHAAPVVASNQTGTQTMSPMFLAHVDCTGCHVGSRPVSSRPDSGATVAVATPESCDACHKPGLGREMIPLWQKTTRSLYQQVEVGLKAAASTVISEPGKASLEEVRRLLQMVRADGSWGVHNPRYTQQILEQARRKLAEAQGQPVPAPTVPAPAAAEGGKQ